MQQELGPRYIKSDFRITDHHEQLNRWKVGTRVPRREVWIWFPLFIASGMLRGVAVELNRRPGVLKRFQCTRWYPPSHLPLAGLALWFVEVCWVGELQGFMVVTKWHKVRYTFNRKRYQCCSAQTWAEGKKQILWQRWISFLLNTTKHHDHTIVYHHFPCKKIGNGAAKPPCLDKTQHHSVLVVSICIPSLSRHQMAGFIPANLRYPQKKRIVGEYPPTIPSSTRPSCHHPRFPSNLW